MVKNEEDRDIRSTFFNSI